MCAKMENGFGKEGCSGFRDELILHTCEREGPSHWQYHKVVAKLTDVKYHSHKQLKARVQEYGVCILNVSENGKYSLRYTSRK
jgi:hypothetical protein